MKVYKLDVLGNNKDAKLAFINEPVEGIGLNRVKLARGGDIGDKFPEDARVQLLPRKPGRKLCSYIGNTQSMLVVDTAAKELILEDFKGKVEEFKFTLFDQKGRMLSEDYWILNPLGNIDCVNREASDIEYLDEPGDHYHGEIVDVKTFVLDEKKVAEAANIFRVPEDRSQYFFKEPLVEKIKQNGLTNFVFDDVGLA